MGSTVKKYQTLAALMKLSFDKKNKILFGQRDGFSMIVRADNFSNPRSFVVTVSAKSAGNDLTQQDVWQFAGQNPISSLQPEHNHLVMVLAKEKKEAKLIAYLQQSVNALLNLLIQKGYEPCCMSCGQNVETSVYAVGASYGDAYVSMCPACISRLKTDIAYNNFQKHENILGGIVGALLGSVIGAVLILLLAQLGRVSVLLGWVMSICTFKGYTLLGRKMTKKGMVLCTLIVLGMTYIINRMDWAILASVQLGVSIFTAFQAVPFLLREGAIEFSTFMFNLLMLSVCTIAGATVEIYAALNKGKITKIGT